MSERPTKEEKANKVVDKQGVLLITETDNYEYYIVKGLTDGKLYDIIYNKNTETFSCACKNIRFLDCYHIEACKKIQENPILQNI